MEDYFYTVEHTPEGGCVEKTLEKILEVQRKSKNNEKSTCETACVKPFETNKHNTIPFILYCECKPLGVEGVTKCYDEVCHMERFVCFLTFIFRIVDLKDGCVVLELLKFKNHDKCLSKTSNHTCSVCCQLNGEKIDNLVRTCVFVNFDITSISGIQCLPAVNIS